MPLFHSEAILGQYRRPLDIIDYYYIVPSSRSYTQAQTHAVDILIHYAGLKSGLQMSSAWHDRSTAWFSTGSTAYKHWEKENPILTLKQKLFEYFHFQCFRR